MSHSPDLRLVLSRELDTDELNLEHETVVVTPEFAEGDSGAAVPVDPGRAGACRGNRSHVTRQPLRRPDRRPPLLPPGGRHSTTRPWRMVFSVTTWGSTNCSR